MEIPECMENEYADYLRELIFGSYEDYREVLDETQFRYYKVM